MSLVKITTMDNGLFQINGGAPNPPVYRVRAGFGFNEIRIENSYIAKDEILGSTNIKDIEVDGTIYETLEEFYANVAVMVFSNGGGSGTGAVTSVNGKIGIVLLTKNDLGLGNVDNTADNDKPVSSAVSLELSQKADEVEFQSHKTDFDNPHNVNKTQIGLSEVNNTADSDKPVSSAQAQALANKTDVGSNISQFINDAGYVTTGGLNYKGTWDASLGTPPNDSPNNGDFYEVNVSGDTDLNGINDWKVKDWAVFSDDQGWGKVDNTSDVTSVNGKAGVVILTAQDIQSNSFGISIEQKLIDLDVKYRELDQNQLIYVKSENLFEDIINNFRSNVYVDIPDMEFLVTNDGNWTFNAVLNCNNDQNEEVDFTISFIPISDRDVNGVIIPAGQEFISLNQEVFVTQRRNQDQTAGGIFLLNDLKKDDLVKFKINTRNDRVDLSKRRYLAQTWVKKSELNA